MSPNRSAGRLQGASLSLLKTRFERIDGVVRQRLDTRQCLRIVRFAVCRARPSRAKRASAPHCNRKRISKGFVEGLDVEHEQMICALAPDRADQTFNIP